MTTPTRSIIDAAATGTDPTQIHKAVRDALNRGLSEPAARRTAAIRRQRVVDRHQLAHDLFEGRRRDSGGPSLWLGHGVTPSS